MNRPCVTLAASGQTPPQRFRTAVQVVAAALVMAVFVTVMWGARSAGAKADEPKGKFADPAAQAEVKTIKGLIAKYAKSIDDADTELAAKVWSNSPDVSFIHPRGHERGWKAIKENVYENLMGKTFSERKLTVMDIEVKVYGDSAVATFYWDFAAKMRSNGFVLKTKGRETQVYHKDDHGWTLVHVHYSGMPVKGAREGF